MSGESPQYGAPALNTYKYNNDFYRGINRRRIDAMGKDLIRDTFPQLEGVEITHAWASNEGMSLDFQPHIGVTGAHQNIFYACAFNAIGLAMTQAVGRIIADLAAKEETGLTHLLYVNRKPPYMGHEPIAYPVTNGYLKYLDMFKVNGLM